MSECKHGLRQGCAYCHAPAKTAAPRAGTTARRGKSSRLSEQMNDRITSLNRRLKEIRGQ